VFSPPPGERPLFPQEVEIAALHQLHAGPHQANGPVTQVVCLPAGTDRDACAAEQSRRDDAIGLAGKARVQRAEGKDKAVTSLPRQPIRRSAAPSADSETPEAQCRINACVEIRIERNDDRGWQIRVCAANEQGGQSTVTVIEDPMFAVDGGARECPREQADWTGVSEGLRRRRDENGAWIEMRQPDDRCAVRSKIRMDREIVTPIARSATPITQADRRSHRRPSDNRADSSDFAAGTPTQVQPA